MARPAKLFPRRLTAVVSRLIQVASSTSRPSVPYLIDNLWHDHHGMTTESVLINCHYPVTPTSFLLRWGAIVRRPPGLSDRQASRVAANEVLEAADIADGYILACQAIPLTPEVSITY